MKNLREIFAGSGSTNKNMETNSCCGGGGHSHQQHTHSELKNVYQCPMKCEGDKTYNAPGNCPVCNMHLALVK